VQLKRSYIQHKNFFFKSKLKLIVTSALKVVLFQTRDLLESSNLSAYFWFMSASAYFFSKKSAVLFIYAIRVYTRFKNIKYIRDSKGASIYQSHALILRMLSVFTKFKFKNPKYYSLSFNFLVHSLKTAEHRVSLLYIKGLRVTAFLETYKL
jgi:hypothetical protein